MVEKVLNGQVTQLPWTTTLVLSDSSVLVCEIIRVTLDSSTDRVGVLVLLQSLPALPSLFLDAFCARHRVSPREQEVIGLLLEGLGTSDMAERLGISDHTVRDHSQAALPKDRHQVPQRTAERPVDGPNGTTKRPAPQGDDFLTGSS